MRIILGRRKGLSMMFTLSKPSSTTSYWGWTEVLIQLRVSHGFTKVWKKKHNLSNKGSQFPPSIDLPEVFLRLERVYTVNYRLRFLVMALTSSKSLVLRNRTRIVLFCVNQQHATAKILRCQNTFYLDLNRFLYQYRLLNINKYFIYVFYHFSWKWSSSSCIFGFAY